MNLGAPHDNGSGVSPTRRQHGSCMPQPLRRGRRRKKMPDVVKTMGWEGSSGPNEPWGSACRRLVG